MSASIGRNDPCPCGSGKKFKLCCLGKAPPEARRRFLLFPLTVGLAGVAGSIYVGLSRGFGTGAALAAAAVIVAGIIYFFRDPPPPAGSGNDPGAINFGSR